MYVLLPDNDMRALIEDLAWQTRLQSICRLVTALTHRLVSSQCKYWVTVTDRYTLTISYSVSRYSFIDQQISQRNRNPTKSVNV